MWVFGLMRGGRALVLPAIFIIISALANALFSHTMEPTASSNGTMLTLYCPREVAHCLINNPDGSYMYKAMPKALYEANYGRIPDSAAQ